MFQNDILFSLLLSLVNTLAFYLLTNRKKEQELKEQKNEYLMMFGITFVSSFSLRTCLGMMNNQVVKSDITTISHSTRPPF